VGYTDVSARRPGTDQRARLRIPSPKVSRGVTAVDYVMVPVPEELASRVMMYLSWKGDPRLVESSGPQNDPPGPTVQGPGGGEGPVARAFAHLDDPGRALARVIAAAALDQEQLTVTEAARRAGLTTREAVGTMLEFVKLVACEGGPAFVAYVKDPEGAAGTEFTWDNRIVVMPEPIARPIAELPQAHAYG
jgi:hypothetical protein